METFLVTIVLLSSSIGALKLPDYFQICKQADPNLNSCILNASKSVVPNIIKGIDYLNVPQLSPLKIPEIDLDQGDSLNLKLINVTVKGLESGELLGVEANLTTRSIASKVHFDQIAFESFYKVKGRVLILPIDGNGTAKIIFDDVLVYFAFIYDLVEKQEERYVNITDVTLSYELKRATYKLDNLFNGDKFLGEQMNRFINDNWDTLHQDFAPIISETIKNVVVDILREAANLVPFKNIFSEK